MEPTKLRELWDEHGFRPEKSFGQNFLMDNNVRDKLIDAYLLKKNDIALEIGPGFGVMSFEAASRCRHLFVVEKDKRVCEIMAPFFEEAGNITLVNDDILNVDICALAAGKGPMKVIGNIPYCISTPIMERLIAHRKCVSSAYLVIQDELAARIVSSPGSRDFGSISCYIQYYTAAKKVFKITKSCFFPKPKVDSALLKLDFLSEPSVKVGDEKLFFDIMHKAFSERRKQVVNPLSSNGFLGIDKKTWTGLLEGCGVSPSSRAESLSLADYGRITDAVEALIGKKKA